MRKKLIAGATVLALLMSAPQVRADDNIVIFGGEFEEDAPKPKKIEKPAPIRELPPEEAPAPFEEPAPVEEPPLIEEPAPVDEPPPVEEEPPESLEPQLPLQPAETLEEPVVEEADDNWDEGFTFEEMNQEPEEQPLDEPTEEPVDETIEPPLGEPEPDEELPEPLESQLPLQPAEVEIPQEPLPVEEPAQIEPPVETERPFEQPTRISGGQQEPVIVVPPTPVFTQPTPPPQPVTPPKPTLREEPALRPSAPRTYTSRTPTLRRAAPQKELKMLQPRFVKLAVDETYTYYLDKNSVQWKKMPYSSSEYIADVWIRMVEREASPLEDDMVSYGEDNFNAEVSLAAEQGYRYAPEDLQVLRSQAYVLEHYYLRPKTNQIQFLCELEVFGRPQNTINERAYDYKNWENLVPGSVESVIYATVIKTIGKYKSTERGHMTFVDMVEEYGRISLR